jgi:hypothetical protein
MATTRFIDFRVDHDDFHIDGLFNICERLLIEASTGLRGFQIESVRLLVSDDHAEPVPTFISDYIASWALTSHGKEIIQKAYEAELAKHDDGQSYAYEAPREHRSIWQAVA